MAIGPRLVNIWMRRNRQLCHESYHRLPGILLLLQIFLVDRTQQILEMVIVMAPGCLRDFPLRLHGLLTPEMFMQVIGVKT
jgi:hypothetical protein